jgi:hypothetical protein
MNVLYRGLSIRNNDALVVAVTPTDVYLFT